MAEIELGTLVYRVKYVVEGDKAVADARATANGLQGVASGAGGSGGGRSAANISPGATSALSSLGYANPSATFSNGAGRLAPGGFGPLGGQGYARPIGPPVPPGFTPWGQPAGQAGAGGYGPTIPFGFNAAAGGGQNWGQPAGSLGPGGYGPPIPPGGISPTGSNFANWPGTPGNGGGRGLGMLTSRFFALTVAHELMGATTAARQFSVDRLVAGNSQQGQFDAIMASRRQMGSLGLGAVGFFGNMREDPTGAVEASALSMISASKSQDELTKGMGELPGMRRASTQSAMEARLGGSALANAKSDYAKEKSILDADDSRRAADQRDVAAADSARTAAKARNLADNPNFQLSDLRNGMKGVANRIGRRMYGDLQADNAYSQSVANSSAKNSAAYNSVVGSATAINISERASIASEVSNQQSSLIAGNNADAAYNNSIGRFGFATLGAEQERIRAKGRIELGDYMSKMLTGDSNFAGANSIIQANSAQANALNSKIAYAAHNEVAQLGLNTAASEAVRTGGTFDRSAAIKAVNARAGYDTLTGQFLDLPNDPRNPNYQSQYNARMDNLKQARLGAVKNIDDSVDHLRDVAKGELASSRLSAGGFFRAAAVRRLVGNEQADIAEARRKNLPDDLVQSMRETAINNLKGLKQDIYDRGSAAPTNAFLGGVNFGNGDQVIHLLQEINDGIKAL